MDRPGGKVNVHLENSQNLEEQKEQILSIINSLVNGKFKATIESGIYTPSQKVVHTKLWLTK